jgi:hypothetical protein
MMRKTVPCGGGDTPTCSVMLSGAVMDEGLAPVRHKLVTL